MRALQSSYARTPMLSSLRCFLAATLMFSGLRVTAVAQDAVSRVNSGIFLYQACQVRLKVVNDIHFTPAPREAAHALMCDSYIQGFSDGMIASSHEFCALAVTREEAIRKYVSFMTENPLFMKEDKLMGVALVLQPLYRCPAKPK